MDNQAAIQRRSLDRVVDALDREGQEVSGMPLAVLWGEWADELRALTDGEPPPFPA